MLPQARYLSLLALLCSCSSVNLTAIIPGTPNTNIFAYTIDARIAGRYGSTGDVAWGDTGANRRPGIFLLGEQQIEFEQGASEEDKQRFMRDFDAVLTRRVVLPGTPDGSIPAKLTDTYSVLFKTERVSLDALDAYAESMGFEGSLVFSSENAAKVFFQILKARHLSKHYKIRFISIDAMECIPEDCGPDGGPVPSYPPVHPKATPTPAPTPETAAMEIESFVCQGPIPLGKQGIIKVMPLIREGCWAPFEVKAILDDERFEVRLVATQKRIAEGCSPSPASSEMTVTFLPKKPGTYKIIGQTADRSGSGKGKETTCEIVVEPWP